MIQDTSCTVLSRIFVVRNARLNAILSSWIFFSSTLHYLKFSLTSWKCKSRRRLKRFSCCWLTSSGSPQSRSQTKPLSGTSKGLGIVLIWNTRKQPLFETTIWNQEIRITTPESLITDVQRWLVKHLVCFPQRILYSLFVSFFNTYKLEVLGSKHPNVLRPDKLCFFQISFTKDAKL